MVLNLFNIDFVLLYICIFYQKWSMVDKEMVEYAEKRLPEFRSAYDKLTRCAEEMTLVYEDIFSTVVRDPKRVVVSIYFCYNIFSFIILICLQALPDAFHEIDTLLQRIEDIILLHAIKEEDIVEDVEAGFPRKKKMREEVKTTVKEEEVISSFKTNLDNGSVVDLCSDTDLQW